jgi:hypothetical protein
MLQFGAGLAATSNPFCVNGEDSFQAIVKCPAIWSDSGAAANGFVELFLTPERFAHDLRTRSFH